MILETSTAGVGRQRISAIDEYYSALINYPSGKNVYFVSRLGDIFLWDILIV
jgi:hypothetical protein